MNRAIGHGTANLAHRSALSRRRPRDRFGSLLLLVMLPLAATAEEGTSPSLTLPQLIATAQRDNRDLRAARYAVDIARARLVQAGALPNPRITVDAVDDFAFRSEGGHSASIGISQDFPVAGRISRQKKVAQFDVDLAQTEILDGERRLAGEVAAAAYRLLVAGRQIQSRDSLMAVDERLAKATRTRFKAAEVSELDVNTIALDIRRLAQERALLLSQRKVLLQSLNRLLGRPADFALSVIEPLPAIHAPPPLDVALARAAGRRPDLLAAQLQIDRAHADIALAKAQRWEDWSVAVGVQQDRQSITGVPPQSVDRALRLNFTIPLPLKRNSRGQIAAAEAAAYQAEARMESLRLAVASDVTVAHEELATLQVVLKAYDTDVLGLSERNVNVAEKGYVQGLVSLAEVVQTQRQHGELKSAALATLDQYLQALVRLRRAIGDYPLLADSAP